MLLSASMCYSVAILVYSENARLRAAADMHQTLLQTGGEKKKCYENFQNTESSFWRAENRKVFQWFPKFNRGVPLSKTPNA